MWFKSLIIAALVLVTGAIFYLGFGPHEFAQMDPNAYTLNPQTQVHILTGDTAGGGHKCGAKKGKSEFSCDWSDEKIIRLVKRVANDNKAPLRKSGRYLVRIGEEEGVQVRVLLNKEKREIVTAYPVLKK